MEPISGVGVGDEGNRLQSTGGRDWTRGGTPLLPRQKGGREGRKKGEDRENFTEGRRRS